MNKREDPHRVTSWKKLLCGIGRQPGEGPSATWYAIMAIASGAGAIGGVVNGVWWSAALLVPALLAGVLARRRVREHHI